MMRRRAAGTKQVVLGVAAVALVALAIVLYVRTSGEDGPPGSKFLRFYCPDCKKSFELSERDIDRMMEKREYGRAPGERGLLFKCPCCGKMTAERAVEPRVGEAAGKGADPTPR
jgi:predicted RNA-binding Zn-ribbon protein involved in translation (DUF1610 family)